jgi:hypothetical protein
MSCHRCGARCWSHQHAGLCSRCASLHDILAAERARLDALRRPPPPPRPNPIVVVERTVFEVVWDGSR